MRYVYVPYLNKTMDEFAVALVREKNQKNLVFGRYKKIDRDIQSGSRPLSVVGSGDRLYVLVHGSETPGVCVYKGFDSATGKDQVQHKVTGEDFAAVLINSGLQDKSMEVRLWTCWGGRGQIIPAWRAYPDGGRQLWTGGGGGQIIEPEGPAGPAVPQGEKAISPSSSFALRVACGFRMKGYRKITVVGYRKLVDISPGLLVTNKGHKGLYETDARDSPYMRVQDEDKVKYKVAVI